MKKDHALLSASSSNRWLACPPSARLEEKLPEEKSGYAEEGSLAHELAETYLSCYLDRIGQGEFLKEIRRIEESHMYSLDMPENVQNYVDLAVEKINQAKARTKDPVILLEQKLDYSPWVPEGFGTGDLIIITDSVLEVIDLKYDKGVATEAEDNTQC